MVTGDHGPHLVPALLHVRLEHGQEQGNVTTQHPSTTGHNVQDPDQIHNPVLFLCVQVCCI